MHRSSPAATSHVLDPCLSSCCMESFIEANCLQSPSLSSQRIVICSLTWAIITPMKLPFGIWRVSGSTVFCRIDTDDDPLRWFLGHFSVTLSNHMKMAQHSSWDTGNVGLNHYWDIHLVFLLCIQLIPSHLHFSLPDSCFLNSVLCLSLFCS